MDGTGELFKPFIQELDRSFKPQILRYPEEIPQTLEALVSYVESLLPKSSPFVLLGESFSGRIAYEVACRNQSNICATIFVATFLQSPRPLLLRLHHVIPLSVITAFPLPIWIIRHLFLGQESNLLLIEQFRKIIIQSKSEILQQRLHMISDLALPNSELSMPCLYLQPTDDILVPSQSFNDFEKCCSQLAKQTICGKHFLLQSSSSESARQVNQFLHSVCRKL